MPAGHMKVLLRTQSPAGNNFAQDHFRLPPYLSGICYNCNVKAEFNFLPSFLKGKMFHHGKQRESNEKKNSGEVVLCAEC